jgi:hypothetical protein
MQDAIAQESASTSAAEPGRSAGEPPVSTCWAACPVCGGTFVEIRHKLHCSRCHSIIETCCEGGRG